MSYWLSLPDSIWLRIFSNLNISDLKTLNLVCERFSRASNDKSLKRCIDLSTKSSTVAELRTAISYAGHDLVCLKMKGFNPDQKVSMSKRALKMLSKCPQLKYLHLEDIGDLITLSYLPTSLSHISFLRCPMVVPQTLDNFKSLKYLNISFCAHLEIEELLESSSLQSLTHLYMSGLHRIDDHSFIATFNDTNILNGLQVLDLENTEITDEAFNLILKNGKSLEELYIGKTLVQGRVNMLQLEDKIKIRRLCLINTDLNLRDLRFILHVMPCIEWVNVNTQLSIQFNSPLIESIVPKIVDFNGVNVSCCLHYQTHKCVINN